MAEPEAFVVICPITSQAGRRVGCHVQKASETVPEGQEITSGSGLCSVNSPPPSLPLPPRRTARSCAWPVGKPG